MPHYMALAYFRVAQAVSLSPKYQNDKYSQINNKSNPNRWGDRHC